MGTLLGKEDDSFQEHTVQTSSSDTLQGDSSQTASSSSVLTTSWFHGTQSFRKILQCTRDATSWHPSSAWVEFTCSPTQICTTCSTPHLQLAERAATVCWIHIPLCHSLFLALCMGIITRLLYFF